MKQPNFKKYLIAFSILLIILIYQNKQIFINLFQDKNTLNVSASYKAHHLKIFNQFKNATFGIDVSEYQEDIHWNTLQKIEEKIAIDFVIIRSTAGKDKIDTKFRSNWRNAKQHQFITGAYHYYRPNENSKEQALNYIKTVKLSKGDFPPILDIEKLPKTQSIDSLKVGLKRWLAIVENHYKVKPIIYSGENYYYNFLKDTFSEYKFWIANYNFNLNNHPDACIIWQFSENGSVKGIKTPIDLNVFNGDINELKKILIP